METIRCPGPVRRGQPPSVPQSRAPAKRWGLTGLPQWGAWSFSFPVQVPQPRCPSPLSSRGPRGRWHEKLGAWSLGPPHVVKPTEQGAFRGCSVIGTQMCLCRATEAGLLLVKVAGVRSPPWRCDPPLPLPASPSPVGAACPFSDACPGHSSSLEHGGLLLPPGQKGRNGDVLTEREKGEKPRLGREAV